MIYAHSCLSEMAPAVITDCHSSAAHLDPCSCVHRTPHAQEVTSSCVTATQGDWSVVASMAAVRSALQKSLASCLGLAPPRLVLLLQVAPASGQLRSQPVLLPGISCRPVRVASQLLGPCLDTSGPPLRHLANAQPCLLFSQPACLSASLQSSNHGAGLCGCVRDPGLAWISPGMAALAHNSVITHGARPSDIVAACQLVLAGPVRA